MLGRRPTGTHIQLQLSEFTDLNIVHMTCQSSNWASEWRNGVLSCFECALNVGSGQAFQKITRHHCSCLQRLLRKRKKTLQWVATKMTKMARQCQRRISTLVQDEGQLTVLWINTCKCKVCEIWTRLWRRWAKATGVQMPLLSVKNRKQTLQFTQDPSTIHDSISVETPRW